MKWENSVQLFIEPLIKENNKYIVEKAEALGTQHGYSIVKEVSKLEDLLSPKIVIFEEKTPFVEGLMEKTSNFFIQLDQPNLDLFSNQEKLSNVFDVAEESELKGVFGVIQILMREAITNIKNEVRKLGNKEKVRVSKKLKNASELPRECKEFIESFEIQTASLYDISEIIKYLDEINGNFKTQNISIKTFAEILRNSICEKYIPFTFELENPLYLCWEGEFEDPSEISAIYSILEDCLSNHSVLLRSVDLRSKWESRLSNFGLPIAVFDGDGDLVIHNKQFIGMNLSSKECLKLGHNEQITLNKNIYRVIKESDNQELIKFIFVPVNDFLVQSEEPSYEELGIISSSVAHELNNPLAGISAALDLLLLDDFPGDVITELKEMKKGVKRCRNLVEVFLGFSKVKSGGGLQQMSINVDQAFNQAVELIRFRLIENNVNLQLDYKKRQSLEPSFDGAVLTMIFYLILGELLTSFSHHNLVVRGGSKKLLVIFEENNRSLHIKFPDEVVISSQFLDSKLLSHLFDLIKAEVQLEGNQIEIAL